MRRPRAAPAPSPVTVRAVPSYDGAGGAVVRLEGRLDAEGALALEDILAQFLREGVRTATIDMSRVSYMSTPALQVLARGGHEFATVKGSSGSTAPSEAIQRPARCRRPDAFAGAWRGGAEADGEPAVVGRAQLAARHQ